MTKVLYVVNYLFLDPAAFGFNNPKTDFVKIAILNKIYMIQK